MIRYGKTLLIHSPRDTTDLFIYLCTQPPAHSPRPYLAHFIGHPDQLVRFLEAVGQSRWDLTSDHSVQDTPAPPAYDAPPPTQAVHPDEASQDQRAVWSTLLELYLLFSTKSTLTPVERDAYRVKALDLVKIAGTSPYDVTAALILCSTGNFAEGMVLLWEKLGMYEDVLRFWMEKEKHPSDPGTGTGTGPSSARRPSDEVLTQLHIYGPTNHHLYPLVLRFLTSSNELLTRHRKDLASVLNTIDTEGIMPTLEIVKVLSRNGVASVGIVKDWLRDKVQGLRLEVDSVRCISFVVLSLSKLTPFFLLKDRILMDSYRTETTTKLKEIQALSDDSQPQVFQVTRCASCGLNLDLPTIHYMCKHSYHQRYALPPTYSVLSTSPHT